MNRIYKIKYSEAFGTWVAVPEITKGKGKGAGSTTRIAISTINYISFKALALAIIVALGMSQSALAVPLDSTAPPGKYISISSQAEGGNKAAASIGANGAIAIGVAAKAEKLSSISIGSFSESAGSGSIAIGNAWNTDSSSDHSNYATIAGRDTSAIGYAIDASESYQGVNLGTSIKTEGQANIVIGAGKDADHRSEVYGNYNIVFGRENNVVKSGELEGEGNDSWKYADSTTKGAATESNFIAGTNNTIKAGAKNNTILGSGSKVESGITGTYVFGSSVTANVNGATYIGDQSVVMTDGSTGKTAGNSKYNNATIGTLNLTNFAGATPAAIVTFGDITKERRLQNVASGKISRTSTDAVNGSQLFALATVTDEIPLIFTDKDGNPVKRATDGKWYAPTDINSDGTPKASAQPKEIIASVKNPDMTTTGTPQTVLSNIKSAVGGAVGNAIPDGQTYDGQAGNNTFLKALAGASGHTVNSAATVGDLKNLADTPIFFSGNKKDTSATKNTFGRKLGEQVKIIGGAADSAKLTNSNIGVTSNGTDTLTIKLAKEINDITSIGGSTGQGEISFNNNKQVNLNNGKIVNLQAGTNDTDAVNVSQLEAAKIHYFSVNSTRTGNKNNKGAEATDSIAIGPDASVSSNSTYSLALGYGANINSNQSLALGGQTSVATGSNNSVAIGQQSKIGTRSSGSIALGNEAKILDSSSQSIAIGKGASAKQVSALAFGTQANVYGLNSVGIGLQVKVGDAAAESQTSVAIGPVARIDGGSHSTVAIGKQSRIGKNFHSAIALGDNSLALGTESVAVGYGAGVSGNHSIAFGRGAKVGAYLRTGGNLGDPFDDTKVDSSGRYDAQYVFGSDQAVAFGDQARVNGNHSIAFGATASVGDWALVSRQQNAVKGLGAENAVALGYGASVTGGTNDAVALGSRSVADRHGLGSATVSDTPSVDSHQVYALTTVSKNDRDAVKATVQGSLGALSIGSGSATRQITHVAAGSEDSDAVNVAQLKSVANSGLSFAGDNGKKINRKLGDELKILGGAATADLVDGNIGTVENVTDGSITVKLSKNLTGLESVTTKKVTGLDDPAGNSDAVNKGYLDKQLANTIKLGGNSNQTNAQALNQSGGLVFNIKGDGTDLTSSAGGDTVTINLNKATTVAAGDNKVVTSDAVSKAIEKVKTAASTNLANSGWIIKGKSALAEGATNSKVNPDNTVDFINGAGTTASVKTSNDATFTIQYDVNKTNLTTNADGSVSADTGGDNFATGESVASAINSALANSAVSYQGDSAVDVKPKNKKLKILGGANKSDLTDNNIGTVEDAVNGSITVKLSKKLTGLESVTTNTLDATTSITTPKVTGLAAPTGDSDAANKEYVDAVKHNTFKLTGDNSSVTDTQQLDQNGGLSFAITGDTDITTVASGSSIVLSLNKSNSVAAGDNKVVTSDAVNTAIENAKTAANTNLSNSGWIIQKGGSNVTGGADSKVNPDDTVNFANGTGITADVTAAGNVFTVKYNVNKTTLTTDTNGSVSADTGGDNFATGESVADAINSALANSAVSYQGDNAVDVKPKNKTLKILGGANKTDLTDKNIGTAEDAVNGSITVKLSKKLTGLENAQFGSDSGESFKITKEGISFLNNGTKNNQAPSLTKDGLNNGNQIVKGVKSAIPTPAPGKTIVDALAGVTDADTLGSAVNVEDLKSATAAAKTEVKGTGPISVSDTDATDGHKIYTVSVNTTTLTDGASKDGQLDAPKAGDENKLVKAGDLVNAINGATGELKNLGLTFGANRGTATKKALGETLNIKSGTLTTDADYVGTNLLTEVKGDDIIIGLKKTPEFNSAKIGGVNLAGDTTTDPAKPTLTFGDTGKPVTLENVASGLGNVSVGNGASSGTKINAVAGNNTFIDALNNASKTLSNVATLGDVQNLAKTPLFFTGDVGSATPAEKSFAREPGKEVQIVGGVTDATKLTDKNIGVVANKSAGTLTVKLAKNVDLGASGSLSAGATKLNDTGVQVDKGVRLSSTGLQFLDASNTPRTNAPSVLATGIDAGNTKITHVAPGSAPDDAVNVSQLTGVANTLNTHINYVANQVQQVDNHVTNINSAVGSGGYLSSDGALTAKGRAAIKTYNVQGNRTYENKSVIEAVKNMNEQGIRFFHANAGQKVIEDGVAPEDSSAAAMYSVAIGYQGSVGKDAENSIAVGSRTQVNGSNSVAVGVGQVVNGNNSGAFGDPSEVNGNNSYAFGNNNTVNADDTFVLGSGVQVTAGHNGAVVLGDKSSVDNVHQGALSWGGRAVAGKRGAGTRVVSVGSRGNERQIQNVAPGVVNPVSTDAVNGSQLYATAHELNRRSSAGIASAMATAGLPQAYLPGKSMVSAAAGHYHGQNAIAVGVSAISDNGKWVIKGAANANGNDFGVTVGAGYQW